MSDTTIAVVGDGVVGLACALNLRRSGANVTMFGLGGAAAPASSGNAGHIATEQVAPLASPAALRSFVGRLFICGGPLDFRLSDTDVWAPWALRFALASTRERFFAGRRALSDLLVDAIPSWRRLVRSIDRPALLKEDGHLVLWENERSARAGLKAWSSAETGVASFEPLDANGIGRIASSLRSSLAGGIRFDGTAQISDPDQLLDGLRQALKDEGGEIRRDRAVGLSVAGGRASLVLKAAGALAFDRIVVAAGVGSGALMRTAGHPAPIIAERGYHIEGPAGDWPHLPPVVFQDRSMIVTRFGDRLRAASFVEFGRAESAPDPRKWARLRHHARALGLPPGHPYAEWMGSRPTLPDYLPAIGVSSIARNLIYAFGHQHLGLTLAATTGELVAQLAAGDPLAVDIAPFDIGRFIRAPAKAIQYPRHL